MTSMTVACPTCVRLRVRARDAPCAPLDPPGARRRACVCVTVTRPVPPSPPQVRAGGPAARVPAGGRRVELRRDALGGVQLWRDAPSLFAVAPRRRAVRRRAARAAGRRARRALPPHAALLAVLRRRPVHVRADLRRAGGNPSGRERRLNAGAERRRGTLAERRRNTPGVCPPAACPSSCKSIQWRSQDFSLGGANVSIPSAGDAVNHRIDEPVQ